MSFSNKLKPALHTGAIMTIRCVLVLLVHIFLTPLILATEVVLAIIGPITGIIVSLPRKVWGIGKCLSAITSRLLGFLEAIYQFLSMWYDFD